MNPRREHFFGMAESLVRKRFESGDTQREAPRFFVYRTRPVDEVVICPAPYDPAKARENIAEALRLPYVAAIGMVNEAWISVRAAERAPEAKPERDEAIIACYYSREAKPSLIYMMIEGRGQHRRLGPTIRKFATDDPGIGSFGSLVEGLGG